MKEEWKEIKEVGSYFQISNLGRVKIVGRTYVNSIGVSKKVSEKIKVPDNNGYLAINGHPFNIKTLLLRYFPNEYINKFIDNNSLPSEVWKDVKDFEGFYKVSSLGRVMSLPRIMGMKETIRKGKKMIMPNTSLGRIIKPCPVGQKDKDGLYRLQVTLRKENKSVRYLLNRLVAETFIPNPDNLPEVNHIDRDIHNNAVSNLEWVTQEFNMQHALLSREAIVAIYRLSKKEGVSPSELILKLVSNYTH